MFGISHNNLKPIYHEPAEQRPHPEDSEREAHVFEVVRLEGSAVESVIADLFRGLGTAAVFARLAGVRAQHSPVRVG